MNLIEKKARGTAASHLLKDEMLQEALREVRFAAHRAFERAQGDPNALKRASDVLEAANTFQRILALAVSHGAAAAKEIDKSLDGGGFVRGIGRMVRNRDGEADDMPWSVSR